MTYCVLDLETENVPYYGHLSNPKHPDNFIVAAGWAQDSGEVQYRYFYSREEADASDWLQEALAGQKILVAHNATFELHWLMHRHWDTLMQFLKAGGRVYCTQYAEYLLSHQTERYPRLEDCSKKYGGSAKLDAVSVLWEQGYKTSEIEETLLLEYLAGAEGDVENTRKVLAAQLPLLKEQGMLPMFWQRMDSLVFNAFCTFFGLKVDMQTAMQNMQEHKQELQDALQELRGLLPKDMPVELDFNWGSDYHLSALLFGGAVSYRKRVPYDPPKYIKQDCWKVLGEERYVACAEDPDGTQAQYEVYKAGKNKGLPKVHNVDSTEQKLKWGDAQYVFKGLVQLSQLPPEVRDKYIGKRAEFQGKRNLVDGTPVYSTGRDSLELLQPHLPATQQLLKVQALEKDLGTYYLTEKLDAEGNVVKQSGMLALVQPDGIVQHRLNGCATVTARLSSNQPNLQNLPRDGTSKVKQMFVSRFPEGYLVEVDYTSLEVIVGAAYSHDKNMLRQLAEGTDMHSYRLAGFLNEPYEEVLAKATDKEHPEHKKYKELRTWIKPITFANQYGASDHGLAFACGITLEQAQQFKATEAKLFPEMAAFAAEVVRPEVERTGATCIERELSPEGIWRVYHRGYYQAHSGTCYSFRERDKWVDGRQVLAYKDTEIANYWCQGEASFIVQAACGAVMRALIAEDFEQGNVLCINTVHDALYLDCATEELAIKWGKRLQQIMQDTPKLLAEIIPALKNSLYHEVDFPAVPEYGKSLYKKESIK